MAVRVWVIGLAALTWGCGLIASQPRDQPQHLFLGEYARQAHGRMTWFDHLIEFDPGTFQVRVTAEYRSKPPRKIAVLPFTDTGSGNYVLDMTPVAVRKSEELADWRWTDSNRLRKIMDGYLAEREFATVNPVEVDAVLAAHGIDDDVKLSRVTPQQLGRWLGADAVVYGEVTHYEAYYFYLVAGWQVKLKLKMVSTQSGCSLITAAGTRFKMEIRPAVALRDIALNSAVNLTDLRDVDLRRAEEEAAREIVWRVPYPAKAGPASPPAASSVALSSANSLPEPPAGTLPPGQSRSPSSAPAQPDESSPPQTPASDPASTFAAPGAGASASGAASAAASGQSQARGALRAQAAAQGEPGDAAVIARHDPTDPVSAGEVLMPPPDPPDGPDPPGGLERPANPVLALKQEQAPTDAILPDPLDLPVQTAATAPALACAEEAMWSNDEDRTEAASHPERFFLPEQRNLKHGRKTWLDLLIETDPETFPMRVDPQYYRNPPDRVAVLPFRYTGSGNLQVNKLIPITFHNAEDREKWRWTIGNRVRRTFIAFLAQREFEVVPLPTIDAVLKAHGIATYQQLMSVAPEQLGRWLHVDALVYGDVTRYEGYYVFLIGGWAVGLQIRMVSTAHGHELINAESGRWALVLEPELTVVDILIYSGITLFESLRDIRMRRAEEETCREIALRLPEVPEHIRALRMSAVRRAAAGGAPISVLGGAGQRANPGRTSPPEDPSSVLAPD